MTKKLLFLLLLCSTQITHAQNYVDIELDSEITEVQPMTGIVFWPGNSTIETDAISLEFSYMLYNDIVKEKGVYDWEPVETLLDQMASRNHQAVLRFRFSYPGRTTTVPDYIKALEDYEEVVGESEGQETWFPDWSHPELERFTIEFYEKYAERYDQDPRLAFVQTGFGLWAEYHIYDGPFTLGGTFPSKAFQANFFQHLDTVFSRVHWSISIDAASSTYSPFEEQPALKDLRFGLFDDSFMHQGHGGYNTNNWNFFDRERYQRAPAGGEFSYYTTYDQENVLNEHEGAHGTPFEIFVENFHMTYINGNDQSRYQPMERVKAASMYMGYRFKINSFKSMDGSSIVEISNAGVAPIYYDAFVAIDGVRADESLKHLQPGASMTCEIAAGGSSPTLTIESDYILPTQTIQYYGTVNEPYYYLQPEPAPLYSSIDPEQKFTIHQDTNSIFITADRKLAFVKMYTLTGKEVKKSKWTETSLAFEIEKSGLKNGMYIIKTNLGSSRIMIRD